MSVRTSAGASGALAAHPDDVEVALTEYEQTVFPRGTATEGTRLHEFLFGDNAPHSLVTAFVEDERTP